MSPALSESTLSSRFQVSPPSSERKRPEPRPPYVRRSGSRRWSHIAAKIRCGFDGSIARSMPPAYGRLGREHLLPGAAVVLGAVDPALAAGVEERAGRGEEDPVRIGRVDRDPAGVPALREPHVLPALAAVDRPVDAVAAERDRAAARVRLAGAGPERAVGGDRERAHALRVVVRPGLDHRDDAVGALPDPAGRRGGVDRVRTHRVDDEVDDAAADVRRARQRPRGAEPTVGRVPAQVARPGRGFLDGGLVERPVRLGALRDEPVVGLAGSERGLDLDRRERRDVSCRRPVGEPRPPTPRAYAPTAAAAASTAEPSQLLLFTLIPPACFKRCLSAGLRQPGPYKVGRRPRKCG